MSQERPSQAEWNLCGTMFASSSFAAAMIMTAQLVLGLLMALHALHTLLRARERFGGSYKFLIGSWVLLVLSSTGAILEIWAVFRHLFAGGPTGVTYLKAYTQDGEDNRTLLTVFRVITYLTIVGCDILMFWRCDILWRSKRWAMVVPALTLLSAVGVMIATEVRAAIAATGQAANTVSNTSSIVWLALSVATNIIVTSMILYKLISTSIEVSEAFPTSKPHRMYWDVATIIIESALPLAILGLCFATLEAIQHVEKPLELLEICRISTAGEIVSTLYQTFAALSPQLILFRVITGRSWKNAAGRGTRSSECSRPICFAVNDKEAQSESQDSSSTT